MKENELVRFFGLLGAIFITAIVIMMIIWLLGFLEAKVHHEIAYQKALTDIAIEKVKKERRNNGY
jgi:predicted tellurium resistance membrane protein TerC